MLLHALTWAVQLLGLGLLTVGMALLAPWAGFVSAGVVLLAVGFYLDRSTA